jgi:hypothetical protein
MTSHKPEQTAYTDADRKKHLTSEEALLGEYRRLNLSPVRCGGLLLSPSLVAALTDEIFIEDEVE